MVGKEDKESRSGWKVWHQIWRVSQKNGQKDRNNSTLEIHLCFLWKGLNCLYCLHYIHFNYHIIYLLFHLIIFVSVFTIVFVFNRFINSFIEY